jgi:hypothetical protein
MGKASESEKRKRERQFLKSQKHAMKRARSAKAHLGNLRKGEIR